MGFIRFFSSVFLVLLNIYFRAFNWVFLWFFFIDHQGSNGFIFFTVPRFLIGSHAAFTSRPNKSLLQHHFWLLSSLIGTVLIGFYRVLVVFFFKLGFTGLNRILISSFLIWVFIRFWLGFTGLEWVWAGKLWYFMGFIRFWLGLVGFTGLWLGWRRYYWVLPGLSGLTLLFVSFIRFWLVFSGLDWVRLCFTEF